MIPTALRIFSLLLGAGLLLLGAGLLGTLLGVRGTLEHYSTALIGAIMSSYFFGFVLGCYLVPGLIRRVGHIRGFTACAATLCTCAIMHGITVDPFAWMLLRFITGVCMLGIYLSIESWLNAQASGDSRGATFSLYMAVNLLAIASGQFLLLPYGAQELATFALAGVLIAFAIVPIAVTRMIEPEPTHAPTLELGELLRTAPLGTAGSFATGIANGAFWGLGAVFAKRLGFSELEIAQFLASVIVGGAVLQVPIGHLSDRLDRRVILLCVALCAAATAFGLWHYSTLARGPVYVFGALYGGFSFAVYSIGVALTNDQLSADRVLDGTRGLLLINGIGASVGPAIGGTAMGIFGPASLALQFSAVMLLLAAYTLWRIFRTDAVPAAEQSPFVSMARTSLAALEMDPRIFEESPDAPVDSAEPTPGAPAVVEGPIVLAPTGTDAEQGGPP